jgi:hypothetical protein
MAQNTPGKVQNPGDRDGSDPGQSSERGEPAPDDRSRGREAR